MPVSINLNSSGFPVTNGNVQVWTKASWSDPFALDTTMLVQECVKTIAPGVSTAVLHRRYGSIKQPGANAFSTVSKLTTRGYYVLIVFDTEDPEEFTWLGYADYPVTIKRYPSLSGDPESGIQEIPCWGFDRVLEYALISTTVSLDSASDAQRTNTGSTFNRADQNGISKGNRTTDADRPTVNSVDRHVFSTVTGDSQFWTTRDIFEHLTVFHLPTNDYGLATIPWDTPLLTPLPDWDRPTLETDGRSVHEVLSELLGPDRMLGWKVEADVDLVSNPPVVDSVDILPFTRAASAITLPSIGSLPANPDTITWVSDADPHTDTQTDLDDSDAVDQVIVRGPREIAVGTFRVGASQEIGPGWATSEREAYEDTYSGLAGWAALALHRKREWNQYYREKPQVEDVYSYFPVPLAWDGTMDGDPLFVEEPGPTTYIPYFGNVEILDELPLYRGVDYEGGPIGDVDESNGRTFLPILVFLEKPYDPGLYISAQNAATVVGSPPVRTPNALKFDIRVFPDNQDRPGMRLKIFGAPQHALWPAFDGNDADPEKTNPNIWGAFNFRDALVTAAMRGDRRPQYAIPASVSSDLVRRKVITLEHPGLQHVNIAAGTVVSLDKDGDVITSDGGTLRDPLPILQALATLASQSLVEDRKTVSIRTGRMLGQVKPGQLLTTVNGETVNIVVQETRIFAYVSEDDSPPPLTLSIRGATNRIDIVSLVGRVPQPQIESSRR